MCTMIIILIFVKVIAIRQCNQFKIAGYIFTTLNLTSLCKKPAMTEESIVQETMDGLINSSFLLGTYIF